MFSLTDVTLHRGLQMANFCDVYPVMVELYARDMQTQSAVTTRLLALRLLDQ